MIVESITDLTYKTMDTFGDFRFQNVSMNLYLLINKYILCIFIKYQSKRYMSMPSAPIEKLLCTILNRVPVPMAKNSGAKCSIVG